MKISSSIMILGGIMNNNELKGKKLLILGSCVDEISLVRRAQELGVYVIVTDYFTDPNRTPAKKIANEAWNYSWQDVDLIVQKCREHKVDGVIAGYSEIKIDYLIRICNELGCPCYSTFDQLDITRDKIKFKRECRKNGVPVVKEYSSVDNVDHFPVIIKPTDRGGSIGISVAKDRFELQRAYDYAMESSLSKQVIIEDFICTATKIDVYYAIIDGEIILLSTDDTINAKANGLEKIVQSGWLLPSKYQSSIIEKCDANLRKMISSMGIENGYIFFSGFADDSGYLAFFECGYRLSGGHFYNYYVKKGLVSLLDIFIYHSLLGSTRLLKGKKELFPELKCAVVNFYAKKGIVGQINGINKISEINDCACVLIDGHIGEVCDDSKAILSKIAMFYFCNDDPIELKKHVDFTYDNFSVLDTKGNDMIFDRMDTAQIPTWWD